MDESYDDSDEDSLEGSDIDNGSSSESSKEGYLPSLQWKRINGNLANNWKSGLKPNTFLTKKLKNMMGPLGRQLTYLDHLKKDNEGAIDLSKLW